MAALIHPKAPFAVPAAEPGEGDGLPPLPLMGRLHLNLAALGVDVGAPDFCERLRRRSGDNESYRFECSAQGELIVMAPSGSASGLDEMRIVGALYVWQQANSGESYPPTVMFRLPSGAGLIPDAAWITRERYDNLSPAEHRGAIEGAPDFVVEVRSFSDRLPPLLARMEEWMDGGARLGWLIDPHARRVHVYRAGRNPELLENPETLWGEEVLPGFVFDVRRLTFSPRRSRLGRPGGA